MKEITVDVIKKYISENKIELFSTHAILSVPIIDRIYKKMSAEIEFSEIKVAKDQICDGHHRYLASLLAGINIGKTPYLITSATQITEWNAVVFVDDDWDTPEEIEMLNQLDANFNDMLIEDIEAILK